MDISEIRKKAKELDKAQQAPAGEVRKESPEEILKAEEKAPVEAKPEVPPPVLLSDEVLSDEVLSDEIPEVRESAVVSPTEAVIADTSAAPSSSEELLEDYIIDDAVPAEEQPVAAKNAEAATTGVSAPVNETPVAETATAVESEVPEEDEFLEAITFMLCGEVYAVDIQTVKEVVKPRQLTDVPRCPGAIQGVFSLRGTIVPMMNLPHILKLDSSAMCKPPKNDEGVKDRIIIVRDGEELMAFKVDSIEQVVRVSRKGLELPPIMDASQAELIAAIGRHDGTPFILLEIDKVMNRV